MNLAITLLIAILSIATVIAWFIALALWLRAKRKAGELLRDIGKGYRLAWADPDTRSEGSTA